MRLRRWREMVLNKKSQMIKFHPLVWPVVGIIIHLKGIVGGFLFFYVISFGYSLEYSTYLGERNIPYF